jgi:hypothetical protein
MTQEFDRALQPFLSEDGASASIAWTPTVEISEKSHFMAFAWNCKESQQVAYTIDIK